MREAEVGPDMQGAAIVECIVAEACGAAAGMVGLMGVGLGGCTGVDGGGAWSYCMSRELRKALGVAPDEAQMGVD
jgi:hypothetical protein